MTTYVPSRHEFPLSPLRGEGEPQCGERAAKDGSPGFSGGAGVRSLKRVRGDQTTSPSPLPLSRWQERDEAGRDKPATMRASPASAVRQAGLSLIELMIAMVVGLVLIAGVLSIFIASRGSYGLNSAVGDVQERGRFALDFVRTATRQAGYLGCSTNTGVASYLQSSALPYNFTQAITGFAYTHNATGPTYTLVAAPAATTVGWSPALDSALPPMNPGSDTYAVSLSVQNGDPAYLTGASSGSKIYFNQVPNFSDGHIMVVSNCVAGFIIQADHVSGSTMVVNSGSDATPGNTITGMPTGQWAGAQESTALVNAFYIAQDPAGEPALFQATTNPNCASPSICSGGFQLQELVPGVEAMKVLYGVNTDGSHIASEYDPANTVTTNNAWNDVVSVRVALLIQSQTGAVPLPATAPQFNLLGTTFIAPLDTRLRKIFVTTIGLRNRLPLP